MQDLTGGSEHPEVARKPYPNVPRDELDRLVLDAMEQEQVVGLAAVFVRGGRVDWGRGYGWADLEQERPATPDTIYRIASISKTITSTALMQLWEQGGFRLDDDIGDYLGYPVRNPHYPEMKLTFRMLLTHTSSLQDNGAYRRALAASPTPLLRELLVPGGSFYTPENWGNYRPGTRFQYSNFGFGVIGALVEVISGESFPQYTRRHIFTPLGMDASFEPADIVKREKLAVLYQPAGSGRFRPAADYYPAGEVPPRRPTLPLGNYYIGPAGAVRSSPLDLSRFLLAHLQGGEVQGVRLLARDTADLIQQIHWHDSGLNGLYRMAGLDFQITDALAGRRLTGHPGEAYGLVSDLYFNRDEQTGVILMVNGGYYRFLASGYTGIEERVLNGCYLKLAGPPRCLPRQVVTRVGGDRLLANGRGIFYLAPPDYAAGDLYAPAANLADALEAILEGEELAGAVTLIREGIRIRGRLGEARLEVNGSPVPLERSLYQKDGYLLLPLRRAAELFGGVTSFNPDTGEVSILLGGGDPLE